MASMTDMTSGRPLRHIAKFALPLLLGNLFQQAYNLADSIIVGNVLGKEAMAAVNAAFPISFMLLALFSGIGMGGTVMISQLFGAKDHDNVKRTVHTLTSFMLLAAIPVTAIGLFVTAPLLRVMQTPSEIFDQSRWYLFIVLAGIVGAFGFNINSGILQGLGDSKSPLKFLIFSSVMNISLDFALIFPLGLNGVALATAASQVCSWLFGIFYIRGKYPHLEYSPFKLNIDRQLLIKAIGVGLPLGLQQMLISIGIVFIQPIVNSYGTDFIAGSAAAKKIDSLVVLPIMSIGAAMAAFTGQNMGAERYDRVRRGMKEGLLLSLSVSSVLICVVIFFCQNLLSLFNKDPLVIAAGMAFIYRVAPFYVVLSAQYSFSSLLRGAGQTFVPLLITLMAATIRVPFAYLLTHFFGRDNLFFCYGCGWIFGVSVGAFFFFRGGWVRSRISVVKENDDG